MISDEIKNIKNVYFVGIGGISMSGLAMVLKDKGYNVSGSDQKESSTTRMLEENGITVNIGQVKENINDSIEAAVYTAAISPDNEELLEVKRRNIPLIPRSRLLGILMDKFSNTIAVAGTHGKTTTTSMVTQILINAGLDPTVSIGGIIPSIDSNTRIGASDYFVTEACEYTNSFLELYPKVAIVLNIELDHIDYFKNMEEIEASFKGFISNIKPDGAVVISHDIANYKEISAGKTSITFGLSDDADWSARNIKHTQTATYFDIIHMGREIGKAELPQPGDHNVTNTLAACAAAHFCGVDYEDICDSIKHFTGAKRRYELKGIANGVTIVDDYAHHPSEIKATLKAARTKHEDGTIWCVFQPHTYSRTKAFLEEFSQSFSDVDNVIIADIYAAREKNPGDISSEMLVGKIKENGRNAIYLPDFEGIVDYLYNNCVSGNLILTMGAGDINVVGENLLEKYNKEV